MLLTKRMFVAAISVTSLLPVASSMLTQSKRSASANGGLIVSICVHLQHRIIRNAVVSAKQTKRRGEYSRLLDEEDKSYHQSSMPTIKPRKETISPNPSIATWQAYSLESPPTKPPKKSVKPTKCYDEPGWEMPNDSIWRESGLQNRTCVELKALVSHSQYKDWCKFLSQGVFSIKNAMEACCFCGGGYDTVEQCEDIYGWSMLSGINIDCEFINNSANAKALCEMMKNDTFASNGITPSDACCACGGGTKAISFSPSKSPKHNRSPMINRIAQEETQREPHGRKLQPTPPFAEDPPGPPTVDKRDWTTRTGLGESPGVPNLEYLGIGYDGFLGNPRGSDVSEVDPGFRSRVIRLIETQDVLTVDKEFTVPLGTELKYTSSCKYDYRSTEVTSESDFRSSLEKEARFATSRSDATSESKTTGINFVLFSTKKTKTKSFSESFAFGKSERFQAFASSSVKESFVNFEAKAVCSEFEAAFNPNADYELDPHFKKALEELPFPYDPENSSHVITYSNFISTYGTHYTKQLVLGAKRIHTTSIFATDYADLVSQKVDVASTLSYETASAIGSSTAFNTASAKQIGQVISAVAAAKGGEKASSTINSIIEGFPEEGLIENSSEKQEKSSNNMELFTSSSRQAEFARKIQKKNTKITEVNVGGLPSQDWRVWAGTAKDRPMPISYELEPLVDLMTYEQSIAYIDAVLNIFNIDLDLTPTTTKLTSGIQFGVSRSSGKPVSPLIKLSSESAILQVSTARTNFTKDNGVVRRVVSVTKYAAYWRNKISLVRPMFATVINGGVGPNIAEEQSFFNEVVLKGVHLTLLDFYNHFPMALCPDTSNSCEFAMTNFHLANKQKLRNFSYLVVDSIPSTNSNNGILAGVVSYDAILLNLEGANPNARKDIELILSEQKAFRLMNLKLDSPTIIVFPFVFDGEYPDDIKDINLFISKYSVTSFDVRSSLPSDSKVGFSFFALDINTEQPNIKHGFIDVGNLTNSRLNGLDPVLELDEEELVKVKYINDNFYNVMGETRNITGKTGGIKLTFDKAFDDLPSVFVTPVTTHQECGDTDLRQCIVESISMKDCYVKCVCIGEREDDNLTMKAIPFNMVVIGDTM